MTKIICLLLIARTHLPNRKELGKLFLVEPIPLIHQVIAQNRHVRLGSPKGDQTEGPKGGKDCVRARASCSSGSRQSNIDITTVEHDDKKRKFVSQ